MQIGWPSVLLAPAFVFDEKAAGADEFVGLLGQDVALEYFAGEVGAGQFDGIGGVGVLVEK